MMMSKQQSRGQVTVNVQAAPAGGWDIGQVTVCGRDVPPTRRGEFDTAEEAETAAFKRAEAFAKEAGLDQPFTAL